MAILASFVMQSFAPHYFITACAANRILNPGEADRIAKNVAASMGYEWNGNETLDDICK